MAEDEITKENATTEEEEGEPKPTLAWLLIAHVEGDDLDAMADMLEPVIEDAPPTCAQYAAFMKRIEDEYADAKPKSTKKLPHLAHNYWNIETETLLCHDEKERIAQLWRKGEIK